MERVRALTDQLEAGITGLFQSGQYAAYLQSLSKLHHYSYGNIFLIKLQCPHASMVAGYGDWKRKFGRHVKAGETGISILRYQQEDGFNTALPYGLRSIDVTRTLTTEAAASLMPFRVQEIQDMGGIYCGVNAVSKNLLICNRKNLLNPHGFILGVSGSGKSFTMKEFITFIALSTNDDIIIIDAEREYGDLVRALRGIVLEISPNSRHHINPLEIARGYGMGENPVALKSELLMSICEQQMGEGQLGAFHKSIIDRCTASVYHDFIKSGGKARQPILSDWRNEIKRQPEREAQELALASELFVEGSLNMFAHETNVDIDSRIIVFDLYEMGDQLKPTALNVTMETIQNRVATNRLAGKYTWVFVDEVYVRPEAA